MQRRFKFVLQYSPFGSCHWKSDAKFQQGIRLVIIRAGAYANLVVSGLKDAQCVECCVTCVHSTHVSRSWGHFLEHRHNLPVTQARN